jgi:hypothetical protein
MPLTVTPQPALGYVTVDITGLTGPVTVTRQTPGGNAIPVRNLEPAGSGVTAVNDRECPFGVPVTYSASHAGGVATAATQLDSTQARLEHPGLSTLGRWVQVISDAPPEWVSPSVVHPIVGRADPIVTAQTLTARTGTLTVWCDTQTEVNELILLVQSGLPVLLRSPQPTLVRDGWLAVSGVRDAHTAQDRQQRRVELTYQQVGRPQGPSQGTVNYSWQGAVAGYGSWATVKAAFPTWSAFAAGPVPT